MYISSKRKETNEIECNMRNLCYYQVLHILTFLMKYSSKMSRFTQIDIHISLEFRDENQGCHSYHVLNSYRLFGRDENTELFTNPFTGLVVVRPSFRLKFTASPLLQEQHEKADVIKFTFENRRTHDEKAKIIYIVVM